MARSRSVVPCCLAGPRTEDAPTSHHSWLYLSLSPLSFVCLGCLAWKQSSSVACRLGVWVVTPHCHFNHSGVGLRPTINQSINQIIN